MEGEIVMSLVLPRRVLAIALTLALAGTAAAQTPPATTAPAPADRAAAIEAEQNAAFEAANKVAKFGPAEIPLIDQGTLTLPAGYAFVPQPEAGRIERANGNSTGDTLVGLVFPDGDANWYASLDYIKEGYIREDDAKDWNADELLTNLKDGTEATTRTARRAASRPWP